MQYLDSLKYYYSYRHAFEYDQEKFNFLQNRQLHNIVKHAVGAVPFYKGLNIDLRKCEESSRPAILGKFPVISKKIIRKKGANCFITAGIKIDNLSQHRTSGSTGEPFETHWDHLSESKKMAINLSAYRYAGCRIGQKYAHLSPPIKKSSTLTNFCMHLLGRYDFDIFTKDYNSLTARVIAIKPKYIVGQVSTLKAVAEFIKQKKIEIKNLRGLITSAELLLPETRTFLENTFHAPIAHIYGSTEAGAIAIECPAQTGYHLNPYAAIIEILDEENKPLPTGKSGRIVVTSLINQAMPLIRYDTGDRGSLTDRTCGCGMEIMRLDVIEGRQIDLLIRRDGLKLPPYLVSLSLKKYLPYIRSYQFTQFSLEHASFKFIAKKDIPNSIFQDLKRTLQDILGGINIEVSIVPNLYQRSHKPRYIRNLFLENKNK